MSAKSEVSGVVVDFERATGIVVLKSHQGADPKLAEGIRKFARSRTERWLSTTNASHGLVMIRKDDTKGLRKGAKLTITGYQYGFEYGLGGGVRVSYDKLELTR